MNKINKQMFSKIMSIIMVLTMMSALIFILLLCPVQRASAVADSVSIESVTPDTFESYDKPVTFKVIIKYTLQSVDKGVIYLGFNSETIDSFNLVDDHVIVSKGSGTVTLQGVVKPAAWGTPDSPSGAMRGGLEALSGDIFEAYVNISTYPHPDSWDPLATAVKALVIGETTTKPTDNNSKDSTDLVDSDKDGLPDSWEKYGVDTDNDGIIDLPLDKMGADPNKKDIFVEIDWMGSNDGLFWWLTPNKFAPDEKQMQLVYDVFQKHNINLHIDSGPDSYNYVNGEKKKWGDLAKGNSIPYSEIFKVIPDKPLEADMGSIISNNFEKSRQKVFRYAVFVDSYGNKNKDGEWEKSDSSGISFPEFLDNEPMKDSQLNKDTVFFGGGGQYLVVGKGLLNSNGRDTDTAIAGTFMHELGHTLGLGHGGCDADNYKPNYLSIMNYSFQLSGLRTNRDKVNYSNYTLPELDENNLDENLGIDPNGLTDGSGLGTVFPKTDTSPICYDEYTVTSVSRKSIDFDRNGSITNNVSFNINAEGDYNSGTLAEPKITLYSFNDWNNLVYSFQGMGKNSENSAINAGSYFSPKEMTLDETIKISPAGTGSVSFDGYKLIANQPNQTMFFKVNNLSDKDAAFTLSLKANGLINDFKQDVSVPASSDSVSFAIVPVPVNTNPLTGTYPITYTLSSAGREDVVQEISIDVYQPTDKEMEELKAEIDNGAQTMPEYIASQYKNIIDNKVKSKEQVSNTIKPNLPVQTKGFDMLFLIALIGIGLIILIGGAVVIIIIQRKKRNPQKTDIDNNFAESVGWTCDCGTNNDKDAAFCGNCGSKKNSQ